MKNESFKSIEIDTPLGFMIAISDENALYLLDFIDRRGLDSSYERLGKKAPIVSGLTVPLISIQSELKSYFKGELNSFHTPLFPIGSSFQNEVWQELLRIPMGQTRSYSDIAKAIGKPSACRAVAQANRSNRLSLVIPCHRVINKNEEIGGYNGGIHRKNWLLNHEKCRF